MWIKLGDKKNLTDALAFAGIIQVTCLQKPAAKLKSNQQMGVNSVPAFES